MGVVRKHKGPNKPTTFEAKNKSGESLSATVADNVYGKKASKPTTYKFDRPVPKYMIKNPETVPRMSSPMKNIGDTDTVIITTGDISRIKSSSVILTAAEIANRKKEQYEEQKRTSAIASQRKAMMLKLEAERKKKVGALSETERLKKEKDALILERAHKKWEEDINDVKKMNSIMLYARTATIREQQKIEKAERIAEEKKENERLDAIMRNNTIKDGETHDQLELIRAENRRQGALMLQKQIEERESKRSIEEELKKLEGQRMLKEMERLKQEAIKKVEEKHEAGQRLLAEILQCNAEQIEHKKHLVEMEKEEEERINLYLHEKDIKEQQRMEEHERTMKARELETARLRALQEKAQDKQAQLDELRAQRVQEALEREWREKEKAEAEKIKRRNAELANAREEQRLLKLKRLADHAKQEHQEFLRVLKEQQETVKEIKEEEERLAKKNLEHRDKLLEQMQENKEKQAKLRKEELEYGEKQRYRLKAEFALLQNIKAQKLKELEKEGVPEKYRSELSRKKITL